MRPEQVEACSDPGSVGACPGPGPHRSKSIVEPGDGDEER